MAGFIVLPHNIEWRSSNELFRGILKEILSMLNSTHDKYLIELLSEPLESNVNLLHLDKLHNSAQYTSFVNAAKAALERRKRDQLLGIEDSDEYLSYYIEVLEELVKKVELAQLGSSD